MSVRVTDQVTLSAGVKVSHVNDSRWGKPAYPGSNSHYIKFAYYLNLILYGTIKSDNRKPQH